MVFDLETHCKRLASGHVPLDRRRVQRAAAAGVDMGPVLGYGLRALGFSSSAVQKQR